MNLKKSSLFENSTCGPVSENVGKSSVTRNCHTVNPLSVVIIILEEGVNNTLFNHFEKYNIFSDLHYYCRSSFSTKNLLAVVAYITFWLFNLSFPTQTVVLDISKVVGSA